MFEYAVEPEGFLFCYLDLRFDSSWIYSLYIVHCKTTELKCIYRKHPECSTYSLYLQLVPTACTNNKHLFGGFDASAPSFIILIDIANCEHVY